MSVWRGRPPVLAGGISDSNRAHCASVRSLGNPLPDCLCASRCSLVHIPNHVLPILAETVNHAAVDNSRNFWVRLLEQAELRASADRAENRLAEQVGPQRPRRLAVA